MVGLLVLFAVSLFGVAWTYVGYQGFLFLLSKIVKKKHQADVTFTPSITLLAVVHNEEKAIGRKIENSLMLDYPRDLLEIIVLDDGSDDSTLDLVKEYEGKGVKLIRQTPRRGKASAINLGIQHAQGGIIVITDGNSMLANDSLRMLARHFSDPLVGAVSGTYQPKNPAKTDIGFANIMYWKLERFVREMENEIDSVVGVNGTMAAIRKGVVSRLDEGLLVEDFDMTISIRRKGFRILHEPDAFAWKLAPENLRDEITQKKRRIVGTIQSLRRHKSVLFNPKYGWYGTLILPSHKLFQMLVPVLFVLLVLSTLGLNYLSNSALFSFLAHSLILLLASSLASFLILHAKSDLMFSPAILLKYFLLQHVEVFLGWFDYLSGRYQVTWDKAESTRDPGRYMRQPEPL